MLTSHSHFTLDGEGTATFKVQCANISCLNGMTRTSIFNHDQATIQRLVQQTYMRTFFFQDFRTSDAQIHPSLFCSDLIHHLRDLSVINMYVPHSMSPQCERDTIFHDPSDTLVLQNSFPCLRPISSERPGLGCMPRDVLKRHRDLHDRSFYVRSLVCNPEKRMVSRCITSGHPMHAFSNIPDRSGYASSPGLQLCLPSSVISNVTR
jgi:hypothetical protein